MLRLSRSLRKLKLQPTLNNVQTGLKSTNITLTNTFTTSSTLLAMPRQKEGKSKQILRRKVVEKDKVKKSTGLTHYPFKKAVQNLKLEKLAPSMNHIESLHPNKLTTGVITKYSPSTENKLNDFEAFKKFQHHELFQHPVSLITSNTINIYNDFVKNLQIESKFNRKYIDGIKGAGKSTLINQALALALEEYSNDVIILHLSSADVIGNGSSDYFYNNKLELYQQPMATKRWLRKILRVNEENFKKLKLTKDISFFKDKSKIELKANQHTLYDYLSQNREINTGQPTISFQFFIEQLKDHSSKIPILISIDDFNSFSDFSITKYKSPDFKSIHIKNFELGKFLLDVASGDINFNKGGVLLAKSCDFAPQRKTTHIAVYTNEEYDPYMKYPNLDLLVAQKLSRNGGISPIKMASMTKDEVRSLLQFWKDQQVLIVREDYVKKDFNKQEEAEVNEEQTIVEVDMDKQFEKLVQSSFVVSQGNPYGILRQNLISY
ncbi:uncharacterized protein KGF55_002938 [Candida pseudojiufengensis]|uniref:uncharacterized protein n=1 Tax=Candida pseudojiufengensis TaxID=497109 RepID=UPI0022257155|nr:uncharacterized protein KGF55_002938 [Candida pseudojiufengensis]KAI5963146.1 hypothetical protein KGF55_002938 [Candida pseudojiufengensis]